MSILLQTFRKTVGKMKDFRMKVETEFSVGYSTGFLNFDFRNGTIVHARCNEKQFKYYSIGVSDGSMIMVIGRSSSGKTTCTIQMAANIIRPFKTSCIFHDDIEGGITEIRKQQLMKMTADEMQEKYIGRNTGITAENFYERLKMVHDIKINNRESYEYDTGLYDTRGQRIYKLEPTVFILDSLAVLMPDKYAGEDELSGQMSETAAAKVNSSIFKRIIPLLKAANIILFVINHINDNVSINPMQKQKAQVAFLKQNETLPGGRKPIYLSNNIIRFDDHSKLKEGDGFDIDGTLVDLTLVKSRSNKTGASATLVFNKEFGFDPDLSLLVLLKDNKRINGAGAYLYIGEHSDMKFSQKKFKEKLNTSPEFKEVFINEVLDVLKSQIEEEQERKEAVQDISYNVTNSLMDKLFSNIE